MATTQPQVQPTPQNTVFSYPAHLQHLQHAMPGVQYPFQMQQQMPTQMHQLPQQNMQARNFQLPIFQSPQKHNIHPSRVGLVPEITPAEPKPEPSG